MTKPIPWFIASLKVEWEAGDVAKLKEFAQVASEMPSELEKAFLTDRNIDQQTSHSANDGKLDSKGQLRAGRRYFTPTGEGNLAVIAGGSKGFNVTKQSQSQQAQRFRSRLTKTVN
ncbi:hypothetical protein O9993_01940 [Vibrio lentus]|nr:hypothetical protein [Vibrio lentus]